MYRPKAYVVDDVAVLHRFIRQRAFTTIGAIINGAVEFAYAPVVLDGVGACGTVRFHLAKDNPAATLEDGAQVLLSFAGHDAYVSPGWYASEGMVPTWNYVAVEGKGKVRRLSGEQLYTLLVDLSAAQEERLLPKRPWTVEKLSEKKLAALMAAIVGFSVPFEKLEGKFKLSQDKKPEDFAGVIAGLEARGDAASLLVAEAMQKQEHT